MNATASLCFEDVESYNRWKFAVNEYIRYYTGKLILYTYKVQTTHSIPCLPQIPMSSEGILKMFINMKQQDHTRYILRERFRAFTCHDSNKCFLNPLYDELLKEYDVSVFYLIHKLPKELYKAVVEYLL